MIVGIRFCNMLAALAALFSSDTWVIKAKDKLRIAV
jgi:hypothetical protein